MSSPELFPNGLKPYTGRLPSRIDPDSVLTSQDDKLYHKVKLHGVYKDETGWHIKEGEPKTEYIDYGDKWTGLTKYGKKGYSKKNKAHYSRVRSGLLVGETNQERIDFLTLSTQYNKDRPQDRLKRIPELNYAFTKLKQKIEYYWQKMRYEKFCKKNHLEPYEVHSRKKSVKYPEYWAMFRSKFKYIKVKTAEGGGVLHIIFRKPKDYPPIPKNWLHKQWYTIWGSWNTSIEEVPYSDVDRMSHYVVGKYFVKQPIIRLSYGQEWVFCGFVKSFKRIIECYANMKQSPDTPEKHKPFKRAIEVWNKTIMTNCLPKNTRQRSIFGAIGMDSKWHSKGYVKPAIQNIGVVGCDFDVWREKIHLKWWDCRIDSPRYLDNRYIVVWLNK
ncbi:MAG: hypothetical protein NWE92_03465 [Candidatus Bathyarchaeota archaeon]|nr:hypothetical protein [Candidatus Bathyarchaeota archaeon]